MDACLWNSASSRTRRCRTRWHGLFKAEVPIDRFGVLNLHRTSHTPALFFRTVPPHNLSPLSGKKNMPAPALLNTNSTRASQCKKPITVESITKHHTKTGAIHYHLIFSNKKEHLVRQPLPPFSPTLITNVPQAKSCDILFWISPTTLQYYEHLLRMDTRTMRTNLEERVGHVNDLEFDTDTIFPSFCLPPLCTSSACVVCRGETGYLNFNNGEDVKWANRNCGSSSHNLV